jgi:hypothetical protein
MTLASKAIMADLSKLDAVIRQNVRRVATSDLDAATAKGASRLIGQVTMPNKIGAHRNVSRPDSQAAPTGGSTKPAHTWPAPTHGPFASGMARPGRIGTMPSLKTPPR